jgi:hypothetical protein
MINFHKFSKNKQNLSTYTAEPVKHNFLKMPYGVQIWYSLESIFTEYRYLIHVYPCAHTYNFEMLVLPDSKKPQISIDLTPKGPNTTDIYM